VTADVYPVRDRAQDAQLSKDPEYDRGRRALHDALGARGDGVAARTALALFSPACLAAGTVGAGLSFLNEHGFALRFCKVISMSPASIIGLWRRVRPAWRPDRRGVTDQLFTVAPALVVLAVRERDGSTTASELLTRLKGPSDITGCGPGHLRARVGAANKLNNLVHTSDTPDDVMRELAALLDGHDVLDAWRRCASTSEPVPLDEVVGSCREFLRPDGVSLAHVAVRLRRRLVVDLCRAVQSVTSIAVLTQLCEEALLLDAIPPTRPHAALDRLRARFGTESASRRWADELAQRPEAAAMRAALDTLRIAEAELYGYKVADLEWDALDRSKRVVGDPWDWIVLATEWLTRRGHF
jgi:nucleoside diphosphate kinase